MAADLESYISHLAANYQAELTSSELVVTIFISLPTKPRPINRIPPLLPSTTPFGTAHDRREPKATAARCLPLWNFFGNLVND